jgi:hypothetical protein
LLVPPDADRQPIPAGEYNVGAQLLSAKANVILRRSQRDVAPFGQREGGRRSPEYLGYSDSNPSSLKLCSTAHTRS